LAVRRAHLYFLAAPVVDAGMACVDAYGVELFRGVAAEELDAGGADDLFRQHVDGVRQFQRDLDRLDVRGGNRLVDGEPGGQPIGLDLVADGVVLARRDAEARCGEADADALIELAITRVPFLFALKLNGSKTPRTRKKVRFSHFEGAFHLRA